MGHPAQITWIIAAFLLGAGRGPVSAQGLHLIPGVDEIAADTLPDLAVAVVDLPQPVIFYNPVLASRYGPLLTAFFLAHEYGHIYHRHRRELYARLSDAARDSILRTQELDADCYAAGQRGERRRAATEAALRFFTRLGPFRFDAEHPTGAQRAARILACMPKPPTGDFLGRGDTGVETGPVSGEPQRVRFQVRAPALGPPDSGREAVLWVDGLRVGQVSNLGFPEVLAVERFGVGLHSYRISLDLYALDEQMQFSQMGTVVGRGHFVVREGDSFTVDWFPGRPPVLRLDGSE